MTDQTPIGEPPAGGHQRGSDPQGAEAGARVLSDAAALVADPQVQAVLIASSGTAALVATGAERADWRARFAQAACAVRSYAEGGRVEVVLADRPALYADPLRTDEG